MKKLNLQQGSQEWLDTRMAHFCASEASAMMGESLYQSRSDLLDHKAGKVVDNSDKQHIFRKGHQAEEKAREIFSIVHVSTVALVASQRLDRTTDASAMWTVCATRRTVLTNRDSHKLLHAPSELFSLSIPVVNSQ